MPFPSPVGYPPALDLGTDSCSLSSSPELEMAKARNQLDAVLQCLLEKSHMDRLGSGQVIGGSGSWHIGPSLWSWVDLGRAPQADLGSREPNGKATLSSHSALGTPSPQFSPATRERLEEEAGKTPSDTHNK